MFGSICYYSLAKSNKYIPNSTNTQTSPNWELCEAETMPV